MISLMIRFPNEQKMAEWVADMVDAQALPARASIRTEDSFDAPASRYVLDGGRDGGRKVQVTTRIEEIVEVTTTTGENHEPQQ